MSIVKFKLRCPPLVALKDVEIFLLTSLVCIHLFFVSIFQIPDGMQMGALGSLRGYKDTFAPMLMIILTYWFVALPVGYHLTYFGIFGDSLGPITARPKPLLPTYRR